MPVPITAFYAALLVLVVVVLGFRVGMARLRTGISLLDGGNPELVERMRRHANFTENVPLTLLLLGLIELNGASAALLHGLGATLLVSRVVHPFGIHADNMRHPARFIGANLTLLVSLIAAGVAVQQFLGS